MRVGRSAVSLTGSKRLSGAAAVFTVVALLAVLTSCAPSADVEVPPDGYDREALWLEHMVTCMGETGWAVDAGGDGSISPQGGIPEAQAAQYESALGQCQESSGLPEWDDLSEAQRRGNYQLMLEAADCLESLGYEIDAAPSFESWQESQAAWTPFAELGIGGTELETVEQSCPQPVGW